MRLGAGLAVVTGGASGLGRAAAQALLAKGNDVLIADANPEVGNATAAELGATFIECDVTNPDGVTATFQAADELGPLRVLVHCAGGGSAVRVLNLDGTQGRLSDFENVVRLNMCGTFDVLRHAAFRMAALEPLDGDRGVCVLTSSIAGYEGQGSQVAYGASKAGIIGMTLPAARDLSRHQIRVAAIAPGLFDTAMLTGLSDDTRGAMEDAVPHPARLGSAEEFALSVMHIVENGYLNGTCLRLDGGIRLGSVETMWGTQLRRN
jgi:NAD(P)-dependent dehydrogenase (short-subunit alcohol dehydrogenase family)